MTYNVKLSKEYNYYCQDDAQFRYIRKLSNLNIIKCLWFAYYSFPATHLSKGVILWGET